MFLTIWEVAERLVLRNEESENATVFATELTDQEILDVLADVMKDFSHEPQEVLEKMAEKKEFLVAQIRREAVINFEHKKSKQKVLGKIEEHLSWLECHNKQYTKEQYSRIYEALHLIRLLKVDTTNER